MNRSLTCAVLHCPRNKPPINPHRNPICWLKCGHLTAASSPSRLLTLPVRICCKRLIRAAAARRGAVGAAPPWVGTVFRRLERPWGPCCHLPLASCDNMCRTRPRQGRARAVSWCYQYIDYAGLLATKFASLRVRLRFADPWGRQELRTGTGTHVKACRAGLLELLRACISSPDWHGVACSREQAPGSRGGRPAAGLHRLASPTPPGS